MKPKNYYTAAAVSLLLAPYCLFPSAAFAEDSTTVATETATAQTTTSSPSVQPSSTIPATSATSTSTSTVPAEPTEYKVLSYELTNGNQLLFSKGDSAVFNPQVSYQAGDVIHYQVKPAASFTLSTLKFISEKTGQALTLTPTDNSGTAGSFIAPEDNVKVEAVFTQKDTPNPNPGPNPGPDPQPESSTSSSSSSTTSSSAETPATTPSSSSAATPSTPDPQQPADQTTSPVIKTPVNATVSNIDNAVQQALVKEAYQHLGKPYVWGTKGPNTFDCSGLTYYIYQKVTGIYIGGWTGEQQNAGTKIPVSQAQPGDLLFWGPSNGITHHVAIYIGNGQYIQAPQPGDVVKITRISDFTPDFAVRVNVAGLPKATFSLAEDLPLSDGTFSFVKNQSTDEFLAKVAEQARAIGQKEGIYASVMLAQAILESGSGNSQLASEPNYNLFGIKGSFKGEKVDFHTLEQETDGTVYSIVASFRKYPSYKESLEDYAKLIKTGINGNTDFYKPVWKSETTSYQDATKYLQGKYATDTQYALKLNSIIEAYGLTEYDQAKAEPAAKTMSVSERKLHANLSDLKTAQLFTFPLHIKYKWILKPTVYSIYTKKADFVNMFLLPKISQSIDPVYLGWTPFLLDILPKTK